VPFPHAPHHGARNPNDSGTSPVWFVRTGGWPSPASNVLNHKAHKAHEESLPPTVNHGSSRTSAEARKRAPSSRSIRRIAPAGLPQALAAWRRRGTAGRIIRQLKDCPPRPRWWRCLSQARKSGRSLCGLRELCGKRMAPGRMMQPTGLACPGNTSTFGNRCITSYGVARRLNIGGDMRPPRAL
jgi:hypothetical protein